MNINTKNVYIDCEVELSLIFGVICYLIFIILFEVNYRIRCHSDKFLLAN